MTSMWQEQRGKTIYRFQTDDIEINNKMKRRQKYWNAVIMRGRWSSNDRIVGK